MRKFLAVTRREYKKVVFSWTFLVGTLLAPLIASLFAVVPMLIFTIKGNAVRLAIVDRSGAVAARLEENLSADKVSEKTKAMNESLKNADASQQEKMRRGAAQAGGDFIFEDFKPDGKSIEQSRRELNDRIAQNDLDAYLIIPENIDAPGVNFEFYSRNSGDFLANSTLEDALNEAVRSERLAKSNISEKKLKELSQKIELNIKKISKTGEEKDDDGGAFGAAFIIGLLIYITLAIYGQMIMGAVVEEKETRIAEILFSSAKPFELMMGKLAGVGLAGLTQLAIWISSALLLLVFGISGIKSMGLPVSVPNVTPLAIVYRRS